MPCFAVQRTCKMLPSHRQSGRRMSLPAARARGCTVDLRDDSACVRAMVGEGAAALRPSAQRLRFRPYARGAHASQREQRLRLFGSLRTLCRHILTPLCRFVPMRYAQYALDNLYRPAVKLPCTGSAPFVAGARKHARKQARMNVAPNQAGAAEQAPGTTLVLENITIVDTRTGKLAPRMQAVLRGGTIERVTPAGTALEGSPEFVDCAGRFVVPGFLDMHTHVLQEEHAPKLSAALMLAHGITGVRQMAGTTDMLRARRAGTLRMGEHAPELLSLPGEILLPLNAPTPEAGVKEVQRQKAEGADFIKTIFVNPKTFFATLAEAKRLGLPYDGHLSPGVDVRKASAQGMDVIEHVGPTELTLIATSTRGWLINFILKVRPPKPPDLSPAAMQAAGKIMIANPILGRLNTDPGALGKTQGLIDSFSEAKARGLAETFAAHGTWQCLTLIRDATMRLGDDPQYTQSPDLRYVSSETRAFWTKVSRSFTEKVTPEGRETLRAMGRLELKLTKIFADAGVGLLAGSDYGGGWVIPGVSLHQEFDLLAAAGLSPLAILQMTTLNGAKFLKREASMGTVEQGKQADLVLLEANPLESAKNLHAIHAMVRGGALYSKRDMDSIKNLVAGNFTAADPDEHDAADTAIP